MSVNNDIAKLVDIIKSSEWEMEQSLIKSTWNRYDQSKRINNFLEGKDLKELQNIKSKLYTVLEDPNTNEELIELYTTILRYI